MPKGKPNTFIESIHDALNHDIRKMYYIAVGLTGILCKISLQLCCEFIDNNRSNICTKLNISKFIKLPTSIIFALHFGLNLAGYKSKNLQNGKGGNEPKKLIQVVGNLAIFANCVIGILMQTKVIYFLAKNNNHVIGYYTWKKNLDNKDSEKSAKYGKEVIFSTFALSLGLLSYILKRMELTTIPIDLGDGIIYNFNLSITVSLRLSITYVVSNIDKFIN